MVHFTFHKQQHTTSCDVTVVFMKLGTFVPGEALYQAISA